MQEENLKLKLLDLEKKFVELEMSVSKINESLKTLEAKKVNEIVERFEEIEDLVLIENAAVSELKELLERSDTEKINQEFQGFKNEILEKTKKVNEIVERFEEIEKEVNEIKEIKLKVEEELNKRIPASIIEDFVKIKNELSFLRVNVSSLSTQVENTYKDVRLLNPEAIREILSKMVEIKGEIENKLKDVSELIDSISSKTEEIKKISLLESKIAELFKLINSYSVDIEALKGSLNLFSSKEDLNKIIATMNMVKNEINELKSSSVNLEDYNQLKSSYISLSEETSKTKENLNKLSLDLELIRSSLEAISKNVSDLQTKIRSFEEISPKNFVRIEDFSAMVFDIKKNSQEIEKIKQDLLNLANRNEILGIKKEIEDLKKEFLSVKNSLIPLAPFQQVVNKIAYLEAKINEIEKRLETKVKPIILE
ncbi:MAG: hypothetical protein ACP5H3_00955 [Candidatus Aenigmatarchaeota archaeon]